MPRCATALPRAASRGSRAHKLLLTHRRDSRKAGGYRWLPLFEGIATPRIATFRGFISIPPVAGSGRPFSPAELRTVAVQLCGVLGFCERRAQPCVIRATKKPGRRELRAHKPSKKRRRDPTGPGAATAHIPLAPYAKNLRTRSREYSAVSSMSPKAMTSPA